MQNNKDKEKLEMGKCDEKCKRTDLLLNIKQMKKEGYPLPGEKGTNASKSNTLLTHLKFCEILF